MSMGRYTFFYHVYGMVIASNGSNVRPTKERIHRLLVSGRPLIFLNADR